MSADFSKEILQINKFLKRKKERERNFAGQKGVSRKIQSNEK